MDETTDDTPPFGPLSQECKNKGWVSGKGLIAAVELMSRKPTEKEYGEDDGIRKVHRKKAAR